MLAQHPGEVGLGIAVHHVHGRPGLVRVHAHVELGVVAVREAPFGDVELRGGDAQVEQDAGDRADLEIGHDVTEAVEPCALQAEPSGEPGQRLCGGGQCRGVLIDADDREVGVRCQQCSGMSPAADGAVDHHPRRTGANSSTMRSTSTGSWWNAAVTGRVLGFDGVATPRQPPGPRVASGMSPRMTRRKRAELGLSILRTGGLPAGGDSSALHARRVLFPFLVGAVGQCWWVVRCIVFSSEIRPAGNPRPPGSRPTGGRPTARPNGPDRRRPPDR
jgi:hypothetical protein